MRELRTDGLNVEFLIELIEQEVDIKFDHPIEQREGDAILELRLKQIIQTHVGRGNRIWCA